MRERRSVPESHERVDDRGRMHDHLDPVVRQVEEEVRLDQLEALVGQRGRVDGDLRAHVPGRMRECLRRSYVYEDVAGFPPERPTRCRQHQRVDGLARASLQTLEGGAVLAVDRQQQPSPPLPRRDRELARDDQALLVCERERDSTLERPEGGIEPREPDDGVEDEVGLRPLEQLGQVAADLRERRKIVDRLRAGRGGDELQLGMRLDDFQRLPPDRAGGPEQRYAFHPVSLGNAVGDKDVERRDHRE